MEIRLRWRDILHSWLILVLLLLGAGIILPCGLAAWSAIQTIRAESHAIATGIEGRFQQVSHALREPAQSVVDLYLALVGDAAHAAAQPGRSAPQEAARALEPRQPSLVAIIDADGRMLFPARERRWHAAPAWPDLPGDLQAEMVQADIEENHNHNLAAAARVYGAAVERASEPRWKAMLLAHQADCFQRLGQSNAAERDYQEILARYGQEADPRGQPNGVVMRLKIGDLEAARHHSDAAAAHYVQLWSELWNDRWDLSWQERKALAQDLDQRLESGRAPDLRQRWDRLARSVESASRFLAADGARFQKRARDGDAEIARLAIAGGDAALAYAASSGVTLIARIPLSPLQDRLRRRLDEETAQKRLAYRLLADDGVWAQSHGAQDLHEWPTRLRLDHVSPAPTLLVASLDFSPADALPVVRRQEAERNLRRALAAILCALAAAALAIRRAAELAQLKARFVAALGPKTASPLDLLAMMLYKPREPGQRAFDDAERHYHLLKEEAERLKALVEEVADISRILENQPRYRLMPVDLRRIAEETVDLFCGGLPRERGSNESNARVRFVGKEPCPIVGDARALRGALLQMLDNAVKYSPPERRRVQVRVVRRDHEAGLLVQDEGYGIPAEEQTRVFDRFYRGTSAPPGSPGTGVGLALVKAIAAAHGARIELQSTLGRGSDFALWFPLAQ